MKPSIWSSTLEQFGADVASAKPVPASVCVAAVGVTLAVDLLLKALIVTAQKKGFAGDTKKLNQLRQTAASTSARASELVNEDIVAFDSYLFAARLPKSNDEQVTERSRALASALDKAIQVPLEATHLAIAGISLCAAASEIVASSVIAEVGAAASLLSGAAEGLIVSAEFNIRQFAQDPHVYDGAMAQLEDLRREATRGQESVRQRVKSIMTLKHEKAGPEAR
jgi:methenyltetrahydrofolate cyclohydrolase